MTSLRPEKDLSRHVADVCTPAAELLAGAVNRQGAHIDELREALRVAAIALEAAMPYLLTRGEIRGGSERRERVSQQVLEAITITKEARRG